jgi:hypothetical protein
MHSENQSATMVSGARVRGIQRGLISQRFQIAGTRNRKATRRRLIVALLILLCAGSGILYVSSPRDSTVQTPQKW